MVALFNFATLLACVVVLISGSEIHFTTSPDNITPILTDRLVLRCSLNDTQGLPDGNGGIIGRRDVTSTVSDVAHLVSLVVLRNGQDLATVSQFAAAHALLDVNTAQVIGEIAGATGERGFLEVTILSPGEDQSGNYSCEANGIDQGGHNIVFSKHFEIGYKNPDVTDIIKAVHDQDIRLREQEMKNQELAAKNQLLGNSVTYLMADLAAAKHFESGTVHCSSSGSWPVHNGYKEKNVTVSFNSTYDSAPIVQGGVLDVYYRYQVTTSAAHSSYVRYYVDILDVEKDQFVVRCKVSTQSQYYIYGLDVNWLSVPQ